MVCCFIDFKHCWCFGNYLSIRSRSKNQKKRQIIFQETLEQITQTRTTKNPYFLTNYFMNNHKAGLVLGTLLGGFHFLWALLVALGWAKPIMDWVLQMHMLTFSYQVLPFDFVSALILVLMTFVVGYVVGYVLSWLFHYYHK